MKVGELIQKLQEIGNDDLEVFRLTCDEGTKEDPREAVQAVKRYTWTYVVDQEVTSDYIILWTGKENLDLS